MGQKIALIIGNSEYQDANLAKLVTPQEDVNDLAEVLRASDIGGFDHVTTLINESDANVRLGIEDFFTDKKPDDLLVMYFSGHGVRDEEGKLYLAVNNTRPNRLLATAIPAEFVTNLMDRSRSRRQVLILDCCHSGAFAQGAKAVTGESAGTGPAFEGSGYGRVVLTATDATQYAWEGDKVIGQAENSVFTHHLIEGLKTGAADADGSGRITIDEIYDYVYGQVVTTSSKQTPGKWSYKQQGEIVIAQNPYSIAKSIELPTELQQSIDDSRPWVRESAVRELDRLLQSNQPGLALAAQTGLKHLMLDDSRKVAAAAAESLRAYETRSPSEITQEPRDAQQTEVKQLASQPAKPDQRAQRPETDHISATTSEPTVVSVQPAHRRKIPMWIGIVGSVVVLGVIVALIATQAAQQPAEQNALQRVRSEWHIVFGDSFDTNTGQWEIGTDDDPNNATVDRQIVDGKYHWEMRANRDYATITSGWGKTDADFYLAADIHQLSGSAACYYGLTFRQSENSTYHFMLGDNDQKFTVFAYDQNGARPLIAATESTAIRSGDTNRLAIMAEGSHYRFFINDQQVGEVDDDQLDAGHATLLVQQCKAGDTAAFEFDNVEVRAP